MKITAQQFRPVVISETELKIINIWRLFNQLQTVDNNREHCSLELTEDGYGWINSYDHGDYLEFPCGSREVRWTSFDEGIKILAEYLEEVGGE